MDAGGAPGDGSLADRRERMVPAAPGPPVVEPDGGDAGEGRGENGDGGRHLLPDGLHGPGGHHRHREYCGGGHRPDGGRSGGYLLDVGLRDHRHDDGLRGDLAGGAVQKEGKWSLGLRSHGGSGGQAEAAGPGTSLQLFLRHVLPGHGQHGAGQLHGGGCRPHLFTCRLRSQPLGR